MIGSIPCNLIEQTVGSTPADTDDCYNVQLQTYLHCGCPTYPADRFCYICDSVDVITLDIFDKNNQTITSEALSKEEESITTVATSLKKVLPKDVSDQYYVSAISSQSSSDTTTTTATTTTTSITCNDLLFSRWDETVVLPSSTEKATTAGGNICKMNSHAAYYCGCPITTTRNTQRDCSICGSLSSTTSLLSSSNKFIPSRKVPPFYTITCDDIDRYLSLYSVEQCIDWNTTLALITSKYTIPSIDLRSYCGCSTTNDSTDVVPSLPPNPCQLCPINKTSSSGNGSSGNDEKCPQAINTPKVDGTRTLGSVILTNLNGLTCPELITALSYVPNNDKYCTTTKQQYTQQCCYPTTTTTTNEDDTEKDVAPKPSPVATPISTPIVTPTDNNDEPNTVVTDDDPILNNYKPSSPVPPPSSSLGSSPTVLPPPPTTTDSPPTDSDTTTTTTVSNQNTNSAAAATTTNTIMVMSPTNLITFCTLSVLWLQHIVFIIAEL